MDHIKFLLSVPLLLFIILQSTLVRSQFTCPKLEELKVHKPFPNPDKVLLRPNCTLAILVTNSKTSEAAKFVEHIFDSNGTLTKLDKWNRTGHFSWIDRHIFFYEHWDKTNRVCYSRDYYNETDSIYNPYNIPTAILNLLDRNSSHYLFSPLLDSFLRLNYDFSTFDQEKNDSEIAGVETLEWIACKKNISSLGTGESLNLQVNIQFSGDRTKQQPYDPAYRNPHIYKLVLQTYTDQTSNNSNAQNITIVDKYYFQIIEHEHQDGELSDLLTALPNDVYCDGVDISPLPSVFPLDFKAHMQFSVAEGGTELGKLTTQDEFKLTYDSSSRLVAFELDFNKTGNRDNPYYRNKTDLFDRIKIIHDFSYGLEYIVSNGNFGPKCKIQPIQTHFGDVLNQNGTLHMRSANDVLLYGLSQRSFYHAGKFVDAATAAKLELYLSQMPSEEAKVTVGVYYSPMESNDGHHQKIHSIVQTHEGINNTASHKKRVSFRLISLENLTDSVFYIPFCYQSSSKELMRGNLNDGIDDSSTAFYIRFTGGTFTDVINVGYNRVRSALVRAIASNANISALRIQSLQLKEFDGRLFSYFTISRTSGIKPAPVSDLKEEQSVEAAKNALNSSITSKQGFSLSFSDGEKRWTLKADIPLGYVPDESAPWPPPKPSPEPQPRFIGYSLTSLLIMGLFSFILGICFAVGGYYVFYKRRHQLNPYQIFE